jgi:hypothetical protein
MPHVGVERRRTLAAAVLGRDPDPPQATTDESRMFDAVSGVLLDISPHLAILENADGVEERFVIAPWAIAWRGRTLPPAELPIGARVILRTLRSGKVVDRIWADISRMTGIIRSIRGKRDLTVELDCGAHRGTRSIVIPYRSSGRIQVRHPQFEPGYLFDAIGVLDDGASVAQLPATSQPPYRADAVPPAPRAFGGSQSVISGTAVWADFEEYGIAYPMLENGDTGCDDAGVSCVGLPYLALGSMVYVRNVCADRANTLPIVTCGCMAGRFCDRCVECETSPRGRIAELSATAYVELGGDLTKGCFNARVGLG